MKLLRLDLLAFGPLQGTAIELASEAPCLHLVYGANEAGKSTALRALHGFFYGIPESTPDAHRFRASELRVGALLQDARGRELYVVRRKGRKQTLAAADGSPLAGADASWITAGMPEAQFRSMFALSYDTLEQGADELLGSAGELGQSLFSAGTGGVGAHAVLESLRQEADALYRPRGRMQRLNVALTAFEEAKRSVREQSIRAEAFTEQQRSIDAAEADAGRLQLQRQQLMAERVRLERARRVLPLLAKRADLRRQRTELGEVAALPDSATEERRLLERARRDASLRIEHVDGEIAKLEAASAALNVNDVWLEPVNQVQLAELRDRLLQYRRAQRTLPVRRDALARAQADLQAMLERLGLRVELAKIESLRVSRPLEVKIREYGRRGESAISRCADLSRQLAAKRDEAAKQRGGLVARRFDPSSTVRQIELPLSPERVSLTLDQVVELEQASAELDREQRACADRLRQEEEALERTRRDLEASAHAGEPPTESQLAAAREARRAASARLREALERGAQRHSSARGAGGRVPPNEQSSELAAASDPPLQGTERTRVEIGERTARDPQPEKHGAGPHSSARSAVGRAPHSERPSGLESANDLPLQGTKTMRVEVDERIASGPQVEEAGADPHSSARGVDGRVPQNQRPSELSFAPGQPLPAMTQSRARVKAEEQTAGVPRARAKNAAGDRNKNAAGSMGGASGEGSDPLGADVHYGQTPVLPQLDTNDIGTCTANSGAEVAGPEASAAELLRSLDAQSEAADVIADRLRREATRVAEFARLKAAHAGAERQLERLRAVAAGLADRAREADWRWLELCTRAGVAPRVPALMRAFLTEHRAGALRLDQLEREASRLERELEAEQTHYESWRTSWNALVTKVGSPADASVAEVEAMLTGLHDVFARLDATKNDSREIDALAHEAAAFERELAVLKARLLPDAEPVAWDAVADALLARDHAERRGAERRSQLEAQLAARSGERERALHEHAATERELCVLMQAAGVSELPALEAAEAAARRARVLDEALAQVQAELLAAADGFEPPALEAELGSTSVPEVQARLQAVEDALERVEVERETAVHTLESRRAGLARLRESRGAADAALDAGAALENARLLAQRYVRVKLAFGVLAREVERYRERHTGPILRGASALFSQLTQGAWRGLEADFGDSDEPVLICVRANGDRVGVRGLSAGTRDQLFLALRLASIEQLSAARELMPLVMDDLLVHFDDDRARAALQALGEFASVTQVLLFTHHQRLCDLAREALPESRLRLHRLSPPQLSISDALSNR